MHNEFAGQPHSARYLVGTAVAIALAGSLGALPASAAAPAGADDQSGGLGEIVVTAQRREERLQDVPISVQVMDQASMDQNGTRNIDDIGRLSPGLTFTHGTVNSNSASSDIAIRGIQSLAGASTTGIYIDDTPIQSRHLSFGTYNAYPVLFDIERVEVLRGPQGTLFGSGSEGGTVRFILPQPNMKTASLYARSEVAFTRTGDPTYEVGVAGGAPIVEDKFGWHGSLSYRREGGYVDRVNWYTKQIADENANTNKTVTARLAATWQASDTLSITPSVYYQKQELADTNGWWYVTANPDPTQGQFDEPFRTGNNIATPNNDKMLLAAVKVNWDLGAVRLVSSTSYYKRDQDAISDYAMFDQAAVTRPLNPFRDGPTYAPTQWADNQKNWTQEIRLESTDPHARVRWTAGLFYQRAKENTIEIVYDPTLFGQTPPPFFPDGLVYVQDPYSGDDKQFAVFGQADVSVTDKLDVTVGLRWSKADFAARAFYTGFVTTLGGALPPVDSSATLSERPFTPKVGLNYKITPDNMVYFTAAKGFRIGGVNPKVGGFCYDNTPGNLGSLGLSDVPPTFSSDHLWSFEVGTKNTFDDRRILLNASAFYIKWKNIQQNVFLTCGFQFAGNLGQAKSVGGDIDAQFKLTDRFTVGGTFAYTDAKFTETVFAAPTAAFSIVQEGDRLSGSPWTVAMFANSDFTVFQTEAYARIDWQYGAKQTDLTPAQNPANGGSAAVFGVPSQSFTSARAGIRLKGFDVSLFVQNVFDTRPKLGSAILGPNGTPLYQITTYRPRTIGLTGTYRF
jgi:outer membrane receptor protein involved in Fe transport